MKARSLQGAIAFYLASRRSLGFALKSEGALLENLVQYARQLRCRGPLTTELALNWAQVPPPGSSLRRARRLEAVRRFAVFWATFDPRTQVPRPACLDRLIGESPCISTRPRRWPLCWPQLSNCPR